MKIGIYSRYIDLSVHGAFVTSFFDFLKKQKVSISIHTHLAKLLKDFESIEALDTFEYCNTSESFNFIFSLGGDGTVLDTLSIVKDTGTPVLGINLGRFGFLANSQQENFEHNFYALQSGDYVIDQRTVLKLDMDFDLFDGFPYSLNDLIVHKKDSASMITVHTKLNGEILNSYWADGLILATPTGSTGYSLSCGGPILFPGSLSLVLTPIAPHNLTVRPLVIGDNSKVSFEVDSRTDDFLVTLDSRSATVPSGCKLSVKKADFHFNMVQIEGHSYVRTLRNKLMWGLDKRN